jgi:hypothetical protein
MKEVSYKELVAEKEYIISHKAFFEDSASFYKGRFIEQHQCYFEYKPTITFRDIHGKSKHGTSYTNYWHYCNRDTFYEIDTINKDETSDDIKYLIHVKLKF